MSKSNFHKSKKKQGRPKKKKAGYSSLSPFSILSRLSAISSNKEKKELLKKEKSNKTLMRFMKLAADPYIRFNITVPVTLQCHGKDSETSAAMNTEAFFELADSLHKRKITGNDARDAVKNFIGGCGSMQATWFTNILNKSLGVGAQAATINKVWPKLIEEFKVQKVAKLKDKKLVSTIEAIIKKNGYIDGEGKYNGERVFFVFPKGEKGQALSLTGMELPGLYFMCDALREHFEGYVVDCEVFGKSWNATMSSIRNEGMTLQMMKVLNTIPKARCFDCIPYEDFINQSCELTRQERRGILRHKLFFVDSPYIRGMKVKKLRSYKEAVKFAKKMLDNKLEGAVLKDPSSMYEFKRSPVWLALKFFKSIDVPIVKISPGKKGKKYENSCGKFYIKYKGKEFGCGTGLTDEQRLDFWKNRKKYIGRIVEVEAQIAKDFEGVLRPPIVFKRFRPDKDPVL